jgi:hypothetical protein
MPFFKDGHFLKNVGIVMHSYLPNYPKKGDVWLVRFKDEDNLAICRIAFTDEQGGNMAELELEYIMLDNLEIDSLFPKERCYEVYKDSGCCDIEEWEKLTEMNEDEWKKFCNYLWFKALAETAYKAQEALQIARKHKLFNEIHKKLPPL